MPVSAPSSTAASVTVRAIGPAVSWLCEIGTMPARLTRPTVGLMPTTPFDEEGQTIEPSVSVPIARAHRLPLTAAPEPELDPHGLRSSAYGLRHCPPRPLQPLDECVERKFAHSLRLALPRITAPAARSRAATPESCAAIEPASASEPAVVVIRSAVSMLSFTSTGTPCSGPRTLPAFRSSSSVSATDRASGLVSMTDRRPGPCRSSASIRVR